MICFDSSSSWNAAPGREWLTRSETGPMPCEAPGLAMPVIVHGIRRWQATSDHEIPRLEGLALRECVASLFSVG